MKMPKLSRDHFDRLSEIEREEEFVRLCRLIPENERADFLKRLAKAVSRG